MSAICVQLKDRSGARVVLLSQTFRNSNLVKKASVVGVLSCNNLCVRSRVTDEDFLMTIVVSHLICSVVQHQYGEYYFGSKKVSSNLRIAAPQALGGRQREKKKGIARGLSGETLVPQGVVLYKKHKKEPERFLRATARSTRV